MKKYPILILPGWLLGSKQFLPLTQEFMRAGYEAYCVDFPGFEQGVPLTETLRLTDYVKFVEKYTRLNKLTKSIFICHSFGGRVALKLLSQDPSKAAALILSGTPGFPTITKFRKYVTQIVAYLGNLVTYIPPFLFFRKYIRTIFYRLTNSMDYYHTSGFLRTTFKNIVDESLVEYMRKIRLPTILIWGEKDKLVPLRIARRMKRTITGAEMVVMKTQGHMCVYKDPQVFVQLVGDFLNAQHLS